MKEEQIKLFIVLSVAVAALIALFLLMDADVSPAITGAVIADSSFGSTLPSLSLYTEYTYTEYTEPASVKEYHGSAGCCNWDCEERVWTCRERSMQCSVSKPVFSCRD